MNIVAEEGSFVDLDIHATHLGTMHDEEEEGHTAVEVSTLQSEGMQHDALHSPANAAPIEMGIPEGQPSRVRSHSEEPQTADENLASASVLKKQLAELTGQRDRLAERLDSMEDELEAAKAHQASLEAALQAARKEAVVAKEERNKAEAKAARQEMEASAARKKQEALEGKVKALAGGLEQRMQGLTQELNVSCLLAQRKKS
jgi:predicted RNase H-like nuclease (RuvC/YqgF family)